MENSGCKIMLRDDKLDDLRRMYALFARVPPTLEGLRGAMAEFVRAAGRELVADQEQQKVCGFGRSLVVGVPVWLAIGRSSTHICS